METVSQKFLGSNLYVCWSYSGKTGRMGEGEMGLGGRDFFARETEFIQNFHKGEIYLIGENFVGKKFSLGKIFVT